jgi:hypothetical protein
LLRIGRSEFSVAPPSLVLSPGQNNWKMQIQFSVDRKMFWKGSSSSAEGVRSNLLRIHNGFICCCLILCGHDVEIDGSSELSLISALIYLRFNVGRKESNPIRAIKITYTTMDFSTPPKVTPLSITRVQDP